MSDNKNNVTEIQNRIKSALEDYSNNLSEQNKCTIRTLLSIGLANSQFAADYEYYVKEDFAKSNDCITNYENLLYLAQNLFGIRIEDIESEALTFYDFSNSGKKDYIPSQETLDYLEKYESLI